MLNNKHAITNNAIESENEQIYKKLKFSKEGGNLPTAEENSNLTTTNSLTTPANTSVQNLYPQMDQREDYYKFSSLFKLINTSDQIGKAIIMLDGELVDPKSIRMLGHGGSKLAFGFGNGSHVFFIQNTFQDRINPMLWKRIISDEIAASKEVAEIGLPTQNYKHGRLSIKDLQTSTFYSIDVLISKSFECLEKENLIVYDCKNNMWFGQRPFLYQGSLTNLKDPAWNKELLQDLATEFAIALAFKVPLEVDTLNFSIVKSSNENSPPKLHMMLYDFSSKSGSIPSPFLSKDPTIPSANAVASAMRSEIDVFITDEEIVKLGLIYKHEIRFLIPCLNEIIEQALTNVKKIFARQSKVYLDNYKVKPHTDEHVWYGFCLAFKSDNLTLIKEYLKILNHDSAFIALAQNGNLEAIDFMLQTYNQEICSTTKGKALCKAVANSHIAVEKMIFTKCKDVIPSKYKNKLFLKKVEQGEFNSVQAILEKYDQEISAGTKGTALCKASNYAYIHIVKLLLEKCKKDIAPNYKGEALLSIVWSDRIEHIDICKLILTQCDDIPLIPRLYVHLAAIEIGESYSEIRTISKTKESENQEVVEYISKGEFLSRYKQYHSANALQIDTTRRGMLSWIYKDKEDKVNDTINALNSDLEESKKKTAVSSNH